MSLPKLSLVMFDVEIPSTKKKIKMRQMTAREEKLLLMAKSDPTGNDVLPTIKQVVNNCIVTANVDIDKFALFDLEYMFIKLRALSVDKFIKVSFKDNEELADWEDLNKDIPLKDKSAAPADYDFKIDLDDVTVRFPSDVREIDVGDGIKLIMKYPEAALYTNAQFLATSGKDIVNALIMLCINSITSPTETYDTSNRDEMNEFLDSMPIKTYDKLREFLGTLPSLYYELNYTNKKGKERKIVLNSLSDFFQF